MSSAPHSAWRTARGSGAAVIDYAVHSPSPMEPLVNLCASGVVERFQKIRFGGVETGIGWVPWMPTAMDEAYRKHHMWVRPKLKRLPSDEFRGNDFPHHEGRWPHSAATSQRTMATLRDDERAKVLGLNAVRIFGFEVSAKYRREGTSG